MSRADTATWGRVHQLVQRLARASAPRQHVDDLASEAMLRIFKATLAHAAAGDPIRSLDAMARAVVKSCVLRLRRELARAREAALPGELADLAEIPCRPRERTDETGRVAGGTPCRFRGKHQKMILAELSKGGTLVGARTKSRLSNEEFQRVVANMFATARKAWNTANTDSKSHVW